MAMLLSALSSHLPQMHPVALNTALLAMTWCVWKSRNSLVFDSDRLSTSRVLAMVADHLRLWVVRAPRRVDLSSLRAWFDYLV